MKFKELQVSIIIVSYKATAFLELTLQSVLKAVRTLDAEVIVVDNANDAHLNELMQQEYPQVHLVQNSANLGFAKANNIGLKMARGKVAILVNPDVLVCDTTFTSVLRFYEQHPDAGGIGVRMLNGQGHFLRESRRGFPTPLVSFYKIFGFTKLFPNSPTFARYYHGDRTMEENGLADVLSGAFLAQKRKQNGQFELLDERYFMYGEDIDLSTVLKNHWGNNYYLGRESIIHFKGKTTPNHTAIINHFYDAMWLFHKKYFYQTANWVLNSLVYTAIFCIRRLKHLKSSLKREARSINWKTTRCVLLSEEASVQQLLQRFKPGHIQTLSVEQLHIKDVKHANILVVFDLKTLSTDVVIRLLEELPDTVQYAYLTHHHKYLVHVGCKQHKGEVIQL